MKPCSEYKREKARRMFTTHGMSGTWQQKLFTNIQARCTNPKNKAYPNYGGRGIKMDPRWVIPAVFYADLATLGPRPEGYSLDRIDVNGNYILSNLRWASRITQNRNATSNRMLTHNEKTLCMAEWEEVLGLTRGLVKNRLSRGFSVERALRPIEGATK